MKRPAYSRRSPARPTGRSGLARVAQLVEHATENRSVGGSIPSPGTTAPLLNSMAVEIADIAKEVAPIFDATAVAQACPKDSPHKLWDERDLYPPSARR